MSALRATQEALLQRLRAECDAAGGQRAWARSKGISFKWVNNMLCGRCSLSPGIALRLGHRKVVEYEPLERAP